MEEITRLNNPLRDEPGRCAPKATSQSITLNLAYPFSDFDLRNPDVKNALDSLQNFSVERTTDSKKISDDKIIYAATKSMNELNTPFVDSIGAYVSSSDKSNVSVTIGKTDIKMSDYPSVVKRFQINEMISPFEIMEIVDNSLGFTYDNISSISYENPKLFYKTYDNYLSSSYSDQALGTFCQILPDIFATIDQFTNFFDNINAVSTRINDSIQKVKNGGLEAQLKSMIANADVIVGKLFQDKIQELTGFRLNEITKISDAPARIGSRILGLREQAERFFSEENMKRIQDKIKGMMSFAIDFFEDPSLEELQYVMQRFCHLISSVEQLINGFMNPLKGMIKTHEIYRESLKSSSNANTARAISAGAYRMDSGKITGIRDSFSNQIAKNSEANNKQNFVPPSSGDIDGVTKWNGGNGDSRIGFQGGWVTALGESAWHMTDARVKVALMRLQARLGKRLIVNSCYRSPEYNRKVGGATRSNHMQGIALDMTWAGFRNDPSQVKRDFVAAARIEGFTGFGDYPGFIHIDFGNPRYFQKLY